MKSVYQEVAVQFVPKVGWIAFLGVSPSVKKLAGTLAPGKGNRLVLANTKELHDEIEQLRVRIRELENALRILQESVSPDPHPLLQAPTDLFRPTNPKTSQTSASATTASSHNPPLPPHETHVESHPPNAEEENFIDAFGV